tara:strand:- start:11146 stop:12150 length:1005 start_codon:yes stop_codon:yes gene_type:complete
MRVTLKQVAEKSGLSISTVSHILSGSGSSYNEATRKRIVEIADKMGYIPNKSARAMRTGRSGSIALIMSNDLGRSAIFQQMITGICDELEAHGYHLMLSMLPDKKLTDKEVLPHIMKHCMVDGVLIAYYNNVPKAFEELLRSNGIPNIWLNRKARFDSVYSDDKGAITGVVEQLAADGHKRIAFSEFTGVVSGNSASLDIRYRTFIKQAEKYSISHTRWGREEYVPREERVALCREYLSAKKRPTAVIGFSPSNAYPVLYASAQLGLRVPEDLSLITFSDETANINGVEVASLIIPFREMGIGSVKMLLKKIKQGNKQLPSLKLPLHYSEGHTL